LSGGHRHVNANVRAALAHVVADAVGSVAAIIAGAFVLYGFRVADPIVSLLICVLIGWGAWSLVRGSVDVLMERTPQNVDLTSLARAIGQVPGVTEVHDLHAWTISDGFPVVTVHVVLDGEAHGVEVATRVRDVIVAESGIEHVTVQPEAPSPAHAIVPESRLVRGRQ
jgi:cobalt-zinc-cadmium efflux system protein